MFIYKGLFAAFCCAALLSVNSHAAGSHGAFTLDQVMKAPFASELTAAPTRDRVAWVLFEQGKRNIYVAEAPDWRGRKLTGFDRDDGQEIAQIVWTNDSSGLYFVRSGDFEMGRDAPNPALSVEKPLQSVWFVGMGGKPARLTEGNAPEICDSNKRVTFLRSGQIYSMGLDGKDPKSLVALKENASDLTCSPDGTQLAFVNGRTTHSLIGVYSFSDGAIRYLDPGVDFDSQPVWSPDSSHLAFLRIPTASRAFAFGPVREAQPFSLRVVELSSGKGREIWCADKGQGSAFHGIVARKQIFWADRDRIVFPWEKSGWLNLYSVPAAGGAAAFLAGGPAEIEHVALSRDRSMIYFSTNRDDMDRRHIWSVPVEAMREQAPVSLGKGIEWAPAPLSETNSVAFLASDALHKSHAAIRLQGGETRDLAPETLPSDFPVKELVEPQPVMLTSADGMQIHAQLFMPRESGKGGRLPALIFFHGGSRRQMLLGFHYMYYYSNAYAMNQYLASKGYIVLAVNYRSGIGYGLNFREALNYGATGASEFNDVLGAGLYLKGRADVDPNRIGLWGGSYGGYLTALGLARASDLFKAGVDFHGVHDWNNVIHNFVPQYDAKAQADAARLAFESSPMASIDTWRSPVLLIQGDDDRNVPFAETVHLVEKLRQKGVDYELLVMPNEVHDFLLYKSWMNGYAAAASFFDRKLR